MRSMRMRARLWALELAVLAGAGSFSLARAQSQPAHRLDAPISIPFELVNNLVFLQVTVADSEPLWFVLDTGDRFALIDLQVAQSLGLELQGEIAVGGAGNDSLPGRFVHAGSFRLVGLDGFSQPLFLALPLDSLAPACGHAFSGILGYDFLLQFVVEIDYAKRRLTLHDRESFQPPATLESLPLAFDSESHPTVHARVRTKGREPLEGVFVLDTGATDVMTLHAPFVERERLLPSAAASMPRAVVQGAGGTSEGVLGRLEELALGSFRIADPLAVFSTATGGAHASAEASGTIGGGLLRRFRVFLDYGRARILLEPNEAFAEPLEYDMSGLRLLGDGADFRTFRVASVAEASPASAAGIRAGDVLATLDGRPAAELTLSEIRELLRREGRRSLTFERGGERLELVLELRRRL